MDRILRIFTVATLLALLTSVVLILQQSGIANSDPEITPKWGGTLAMSSQWEHQSLNPNFRGDDQAMRICQLGILSPLIGLDYVYTAEELYPVLAKSWEASADATVFTFHLYENVSWHDGVKFTSADVKWTFEEIIDKKGYSYDYFKDVEKIEVPDDYTVKITLKSGNAAFLSQLGGHYAPTILPKHLYEGTDWSTNPYNEKPVGTGPFKFVEWVKGDHVTMEAYDGYHLGRPYLDRIIVRSPIDFSTQVLMLKAGELQTIFMSPPAAECLEFQADPNFNTFPMNYYDFVHLGFNLRRAPYDDLMVRQAICHAINTTDVAIRATLGTCEPASGYWYKDNPFYNPDAQPPEYNETKAEELLDQAGYPRDPVTGIRFKTTLGSWTNPLVQDCQPIIREYLRRVGIECDIYALTWTEWVERFRFRRDFDLGMLGEIQGPDPTEFESFVVTGGYSNIPGFNSSRIDELMELVRTNVDPEKRKEYFFEVQQILADNVPRLNIHEWRLFRVYSADFAGFPTEEWTRGPGYQLWNYQKVFWKQGSVTSPKEANAIIEDVENELEDLEGQGIDVSGAMVKLNEAKAAYADGKYDDAKNLANEALDLPEVPEEIPYILYAAVAAVAVIVVGSAVYVYKKRKR